MKKHRFLVAVLAVAVMLMGAGYAYWTQSLTITNSVSTGYLDVQFVDGSEMDWDDGILPFSDLVSASKEIAPGGQSMTFTVENLYPGAGAALHFGIKNTGTVNAKVAEITGAIPEGGNAALADALFYVVDTVKIKNFFGWQVYSIEPVMANSFDEFISKLNNSGIKNIILAPGDELYLLNSSSPGYSINMPADITGSDFEDEDLIFDLGINFVQVNL